MPDRPISDHLSLAKLLRIEPLRATLRGSVIRPAKGSHADFTHFLLVDHGSASLQFAGEDHPLTGPAAAVVPPHPDAELALAAGMTGWLIGAAPLLIAESVGSKADSGLLHSMTGRLVIARNTDARFIADFLYPAEQIERERAQAAPAAHLAVVAYLRLVLVAFWREARFHPDAVRGRSAEQHLLQGFRRLVELHFRKQMPVARYAELLGISYDRLHDICARSLQRSPLKLVHQRMMREAATRLERSGETIQDIAHSLGFGDPSQFSHFFKRNSRMAPTLYRDTARQSEAGLRVTAASFADWP